MNRSWRYLDRRDFRFAGRARLRDFAADLAAGLRFFELERPLDFLDDFADFLRDDLRFDGVTLRTAAAVDLPIDFWAALALAAMLPRAVPMLSATVVSSPWSLSPELTSSVMCAPTAVTSSNQFSSVIIRRAPTIQLRTAQTIWIFQRQRNSMPGPENQVAPVCGSKNEW